MKTSTKKKWDPVLQISTLLLTTIPVYFLFKTSPKEITSSTLTIFGIIIGVVISITIFTIIYNKYKEMNEEIKNNKENINEIKKHLNFKDIFTKMDTRLRVIERLMDRKGQINIDPRWIMLGFLIILVILFLRQIGVI